MKKTNYCSLGTSRRDSRLVFFLENTAHERKRGHAVAMNRSGGRRKTHTYSSTYCTVQRIITTDNFFVRRFSMLRKVGWCEGCGLL